MIISNGEHVQSMNPPVPTSSDQLERTILQDNGEYKARNIFNGGLVPETAKVLERLRDGASIADIRLEVFEG